MQDAFIIKEAKRYFIKTKELLSGEKKYYINDLGFLNYLFPKLRVNIASLLENIVFTHLHRAGYDVTIGYARNYEIDFIATKNTTNIYIQVTYLLASEKTISREFGTFDNVKNNFPKYVISLDDIKINHSSGVLHEHVWDFIYNLK